MQGRNLYSSVFAFINKPKACVGADYEEKERIKIRNKREAEIIIKEIEDLIKKDRSYRISGNVTMDLQKCF